MKWFLCVCRLMVLGATLNASAYADTETAHVAWVSEVQGNLMKDLQGRLYSHLAYPNYGLSRINKVDGKPLWSITFPSFANFDASCVDSDRIIILVDKTLMALNPDTGATLWSYQQQGTGNLWLSCLQRSNDVYLIYADVTSTISSIQKLNGQKIWDYAAGINSYIFNADWQSVYINQPDAGTTSVIALKQWNGETQWTRQFKNNIFASTDPLGRVYTTGNGGIHRLSPSTGQDLWGYKGSDEFAYLEFNTQGHVFAHESKTLNRLDPDSGHIQWSKELESSETTYSQTILLKSSDLVIRTNYLHENRAKTTYVNGWDGGTRWETWLDSAQGYIVEDEAQTIYQIEGRKLLAMDSNNGQIRWTYELQSEPGQNIFQLYGRDEHLYLTYGYPVRYPPMGLVRLSAANGSVYWQQFLGTPFGIVDWDLDRVYTSSYNQSRSVAYE